MARTQQNRDAVFYARRLFGPCFILLVGTFVLRAWLDASWVERRVGWMLRRAAKQATVEEQDEGIVAVEQVLDGYKRHIAGASLLIPHLDTTRIDKVRDDLDWYRLQTVHVYAESQEHEHWLKILDKFLTHYDAGDLGVARPRHRRVLTIMLWTFGSVSVISLFIKLSWHEWGEM